MDLTQFIHLRKMYAQHAADRQAQGMPAQPFEEWAGMQMAPQAPQQAPMTQDQFSNGRRPQNPDQLRALLAKRGLLSQ